MSLELRFAALSDVGRVRQDNQDSGYAGPHLLVVADGVGGAARGDIASRTAVQQLRSLDEAPGNNALEALAGSIHLAHNRLADLVADDPELDGTSTTTTALLFDGDGVNIAHVGDSRAYLLRDGELRGLTKDHTFVQSLVDEGRITEDDAKVHPHRNLILRAVDGVHEPEPDLSRVEVQPGDRLMLCSDGCCGVLSDDAMAELLTGADLEYVPGALVTAALEAGSTDNVTVVVAEVVADPTTPAGSPVTVGAAGEASVTTTSIDRVSADPPSEDPEAIRYAPLPPRRFTWLRRLAALVVVLAILAGLGYAGYRWTQTRYYVGVDDNTGTVAIFKGVDWNLPIIDLDHVDQRSTLPSDRLGEPNQAAVEAGIPVDNKQAAQRKLADLVQRACSDWRANQRQKAAAAKAKKRAAQKAAHKKAARKKAGNKTTTKKSKRKSAASSSTTTPAPSTTNDPMRSLCGGN
ncbi:MAG TPA: protein phosphatase 2C domain-containing protein [Marmoricola sp.]